MKYPRFIKRECKILEPSFSQSSLTIWLIYNMQRESNLYSQQKGRSLGIDKIEALTLLGITLLSEYNRLPYRRLHWSESADIHNSLVSDSLRRNMFNDIVSDLYNDIIILICQVTDRPTARFDRYLEG